ncbi:hypothetical protein Tco_0847118 [Tanacetum coccineum]
MVSYLKKTEGSERIHQIVDFLNASHIRYDLTKNPTIYVSLIQQIWGNATNKPLVHGEIEITTTIDRKVKIVSEASIRRHLKLEHSDGPNSLGSSIRQETEVPQPSSPPHTHVADKAASIGVDVKHGGLVTTVTSLDARQGSGNINKTSSMPHDSPLSRVNTLGSDEGSMDNQSVLALQDFEQSPVMDVTDNEISSDSNIIPYSQYLSHEKMIDSQMDDMIRHKLALKEQINSLEQNLSKQIKEKESLFKTFTIFKNESKEKENKYMENEIDLEKKIKELDNIVYKVGQSAQTVHMLTKPQTFYDNTHKQALGYQIPFYLRKAQRIKPTLYDGAVISKTHVAMLVINDEKTLILEEESQSKMFEKAKDPEVIAKKISHKPIDYEKLNSLIEDFVTHFSPQQELSAEQAFWFHTFNPSIELSYSPPIIVDVPSELPKVSLVNGSLKMLKFHLTQFDSVVNKRTTPSALEEGE